MRTLDDTIWFASTNEFAFAVYGDDEIPGPDGPPVPEPSTLVLSAMGLAGLGLITPRKKYRRA